MAFENVFTYAIAINNNDIWKKKKNEQKFDSIFLRNILNYVVALEIFPG